MGVSLSAGVSPPKFLILSFLHLEVTPPPRKKYTKKESFQNKTGSQFGFVGGTKPRTDLRPALIARRAWRTYGGLNSKDDRRRQCEAISGSFLSSSQRR